MFGFMKLSTTAYQRPNSVSGKTKNTAQPLFIYRRIQELQEESGLSFHTLLLDWEKAFDKVDQKRMIQAIKRLGTKDKIIRMIEAIYKEPKFSIKDGNAN